MGKHASWRQHQLDGATKRQCRRCGIAFEVYGNSEPEHCDGCEEDLADQEIEPNEIFLDSGDGEIPLPAWTVDSAG